MTRVVLLTGKGGVGKTTTAAGTAVLAGERGLRTLVLSTDAAHSLSDAFGVSAGGSADGHTPVAERVWIQQVDAQRRFEDSWASIQDYLRAVLDAAGTDPITAEEITVLPGAEEVLALLALRDEVVSGAWDLVVVDCAPTAETLRLLALPEALGWYLDRLATSGSRVVRAVTPALARAAGVPVPEPRVGEAVQRLHADLREVRTLLAAPTSSVRLVLTPESVVVAEARRALTTLSLYGYTVDGVVANRVFPDSDDDKWRRTWAEAQRETLADVETSFAPLPVWRAEYAPREPVGAAALAELARAAYGESDPVAVVDAPPPMDVVRRGAEVELRLALPFATGGEVGLTRHGGDLVVTVGSYRRVLALPSMLTRYAVTGAHLDAGHLAVRFAPPPETRATP
ncbi:ArsA family ATPase [Mumia sp. ZJ1417]|uniref:ArsA family ATPase n=1 Tax=Mumia sp. ZJ1417 TaxID=2708082 RepID=UPI001FBAD3B0|nr:ArsA family ATPase [Mumia sp. ZJ1417]